MIYLLDTHAFIWMDSAPAQLSQTASRIVVDPNNEILLSTVSVWEMVIKTQIGKLKLRDSIRTIVADQIGQNRVRLLDVHLDHVYAVQPLPLHHRDPFDRFLIAQAQLENATLLTNDPLIKQYAVPTDW
jgi:PIN domain nuclease of toxin-antitoxin system